MAAGAKDLIGQTLAGRFHLRSHLGGGGAGDVFAAEIEGAPGRFVALKLVRPFGLDMGDTEKRFLREIKNTLRLQHPHVVEIYEAGALPDGKLWYTMEMCRGKTLSRLARGEPRMALPRAVALCAQILEALTAAHALDMVHRDVKPENIFVTGGPGGREHAKLLDFGLAKIVTGGATQQVTRQGMSSGTVAYMPREQLLGTKLDGRADLHALGATLFECLAGRPPILERAGADDDAYRAVMKTVPPPLDVLCAGRVPTALSKVVARSLEKRPEDRFPSAEAMRQALFQACPEAARPDALPFAGIDESPSARPLAAPVLAPGPGGVPPTRAQPQALPDLPPIDSLPPTVARPVPPAPTPAPPSAAIPVTAILSGPVSSAPGSPLSFDGTLPLGGRYALRALVHRGSHGPLHHAEDLATRTPVAVKILLANGPMEREDWTRYERGLTLLRSIRHPHVVAFLDVGLNPNGVPYLVLEWLAGSAPLEAFLRRRGRIPAREACGVLCQALAGLHAAHAQGIVHRDLSPRTVLVAPTPEGADAKLTGFGHAKRVYGPQPSVTSWGKPVGVRGYMAPEQLRGLPVDARADVFAAGCLLHHMVAGAVPFEHADEMAYAQAVLKAPLPPLPAAVPEPDRAFLEPVLRGALAKRAEDRYASADALRQALLPLAAGLHRASWS